MGTAAFAVLMYAAYKAVRFMEVFLGNHMSHVQSSLNNMEGHMSEMKDALNKLASKE